MPAKINISKEVQAAFDANSHVIRDMNLYAQSAFLKALPEGVNADKIHSSSRYDSDGNLIVELGYTVENVPAHGTWYFNFMFRPTRVNVPAGAIMVTRQTDKFDTRSCQFQQEALDSVVKELAAL